MQFIKGLFYAGCGCLMTIFYREGMEIAMSWTFVIWLPFIAHDLAEAITPYPTKKKSPAMVTPMTTNKNKLLTKEIITHE